MRYRLGNRMVMVVLLVVLTALHVGCGAVCSLSGVGFDEETGSFVELSVDDSGSGLPDERVVALN